jgi:hypothetical protein
VNTLTRQSKSTHAVKTLGGDLQAVQREVEAEVRRFRTDLTLRKLATVARKHGLRTVYVVDRYNEKHGKVMP